MSKFADISFVESETKDGKELKERIRLLCDGSVRVGFFGGRHFKTDRSGNTKDIVLIAAENELGTPKIPSRPFMSMSADELNGRDGDVIEKNGVEYIQKGGSTTDVFERIGKACVGVIRKVINSGKFVPNSPVTVAIKGRNKPLIDTGTMMNSVEYEIQKKGGG